MKDSIHLVFLLPVLLALLPTATSLLIPLRKDSLPERAILDNRDADPDTCGPGVGSCAATKCCSPSGYCGVGIAYCASPDCQIAYGPFCDSNQAPAGPSTAGIARPLLGNVPYGGPGLYHCVNPGQIAITFDDGPYLYTSELLNTLDAYNVRATFFITGNNKGKGMISNPTTPWPALIQRMASEGHQIASHSWSHENVTAIPTSLIENQIVYNEMAFNDILGYFPTYYRPPYSICDDACVAFLTKYGYHITYFDLDTQGYVYPNNVSIPISLWDAAIAAPAATTDYLQIEHDIVQSVVEVLVPHMMATLTASGYTPVTLGECLNDPPENWYRAASGTVPPYPRRASTPSPSPSPSSLLSNGTPSPSPASVPNTPSLSHTTPTPTPNPGSPSPTPSPATPSPSPPSPTPTPIPRSPSPTPTPTPSPSPPSLANSPSPSHPSAQNTPSPSPSPSPSPRSPTPTPPKPANSPTSPTPSPSKVTSPATPTKVVAPTTLPKVVPPVAAPPATPPVAANPWFPFISTPVISLPTLPKLSLDISNLLSGLWK